MPQEQSVKNPKEIPPHLQLMNLAHGFWTTQAIHVSAKLGLADIIGKDPMPLEVFP